MKNYPSLANEKLLNTFIIFTSVKYLYFYKKKKKMQSSIKVLCGTSKV